MLTQQLHIKSVVAVTEKHRLAAIATLGEWCGTSGTIARLSFTITTAWQKRARVKRVSWTRNSITDR
jgi:hypothetical protein